MILYNSAFARYNEGETAAKKRKTEEMTMDDLSLHYKRLLENWAAFARRDLFRPVDQPI